MASIPCKTNPMGKSKEPYFSLIVKPGILGGMTYGFRPSWNSGGYCRVLDWGDGVTEDAVQSGKIFTHTYALPGTYKIKIIADCWEVAFGNYSGAYPDYCPLVYDCNGQWNFLGRLTSMNCVMRQCSNAVYTLDSIPPTVNNLYYAFMNNNKANLLFDKFPDVVTNAQVAFSGCSKSRLKFRALPKTGNLAQLFYYNQNSAVNILEIPEECTELTQTFYQCHGQGCYINIKKLPDNIHTIDSAFYRSENIFIDISELASNAPPEGYTKLTNINAAFYQCPNVTGSRSAFLAKCPNAIVTDFTFEGTNTTE